MDDSGLSFGDHTQCRHRCKTMAVVLTRAGRRACKDMIAARGRTRWSVILFARLPAMVLTARYLFQRGMTRSVERMVEGLSGMRRRKKRGVQLIVPLSPGLWTAAARRCDHSDRVRNFKGAGSELPLSNQDRKPPFILRCMYLKTVSSTPFCHDPVLLIAGGLHGLPLRAFPTVPPSDCLRIDFPGRASS